MNQLITIKDKQFRPYISQQNIETAVKEMAARINAELKDELPLFLVVLNGAFMFASDLLKEISIPCDISFIKMASYMGTGSSGRVTELIGLNDDVSGRTVVIVEVIVDTGLTVEGLTAALDQKNVKQVKIATAFMKPDCYTKNCPIDYVGIAIGNEFIVGYGLDYDGHGRNLKEIYILV